MDVHSTEQLNSRRCSPCEGGVEPCTIAHSQHQLAALQDWQLDAAGKSISREWKMKNFVHAMKLVNAVAELAEQEQHHPDLHLTGYRHLRIELTTHAIDGLSENDFILAAKIDSAAQDLGC